MIPKEFQLDSTVHLKGARTDTYDSTVTSNDS